MKAGQSFCRQKRTEERLRQEKSKALVPAHLRHRWRKQINSEITVVHDSGISRDLIHGHARRAFRKGISGPGRAAIPGHNETSNVRVTVELNLLMSENPASGSYDRGISADLQVIPR